MDCFINPNQDNTLNHLTMKIILALILFPVVIISSSGFTQEGKYQGLLWEISGNGLDQPSYLYGTMHVSNKLAFNVSDSFYICLNNVQSVALESSPDQWIEDYQEIAAISNFNFGFGSKDLYNSAFVVKRPGTNDVYLLLKNKNSLMNQILYRYNPGHEDYQEDTFLDMFIFQAGKKNGKTCYSLETIMEVMDLTLMAMAPDDDDDKRDNDYNSYLDKDLVNMQNSMQDYYRRGDLDKLDSLNKATSGVNYHKYFIVERNKNMMRRMDSIMKVQSVFTGIGASHLPGEDGAIEILRRYGYTVRPVSPKSSGKSHKMRKKFAKLYAPVPFDRASTSDEFATMSVPGKLYEMNTNKRGKMEYLTPEPINGGYFSVIRLFTYGPMFNKTPEFYKETFDSLMYIATPGEIIEKNDIMNGGHKGYQILSETSKNSFVNYQVFFTPTEVIMFKGSGNEDYINKDEPQSFFTNIKLKPNSSEWSDVSSKYGGAKWKMKGLVTGQDMIEGMDSESINPLYQSYDEAEENYYLLMRYAFNDIEYIEEDSFDLAFLGQTFAEDIGYDVSSSINGFKDNRTYIDQILTRKPENLHLRDQLKVRLIAKGGLYYLMLTTATNNSANDYFSSFEFTDFNVVQNYETIIDSSLSYTVETIKLDNKDEYMAKAMSIYKNSKKVKENKDYQHHVKEKTYTDPRTSEEVFVHYRKFNDYDGASSEERFWDYRVELISEDNGFIVSRKEYGKVGDAPSLSFLLSDTGSARGILTKMMLHNGVVYTIQSLIDTISGPSDYVQTFFDTFKPLDTLIGRSIFEDKSALYFNHINGTDSLNKVNAMKSIYKIDFVEEDIPKIIDTYKNYEFDEKTEMDNRQDLIMALSDFESDEAYAFLRETFNANTYKSEIQFSVLNSLSSIYTQESYDIISELLLENTPLTDDYQNLKFFSNFYDSLELTKSFFPEILSLTTYPEYETNLIEMLAFGYMEGVYNEDHFKKEKNLLIKKANVEIKRTLADQKSETDEESDYSRYSPRFFNRPYSTTLLDYYILMSGLRKNGNKDVESFFEGIKNITDKPFMLEAQIVNNKLGLDVDRKVINEVTEELKYRVWVYNRFTDEEMMEYFDPEITQHDLVMSYLYDQGYNEDEDTIVFIKKVFVNDGRSSGNVYFFKRKTESTKNWMIDYVGIQPTNEDEFMSYSQLTKKGLSVKNDKEMEKTFNKTLDKFTYRHRSRVVFNNYGDWSNLFGF